MKTLAVMLILKKGHHQIWSSVSEIFLISSSQSFW